MTHPEIIHLGLRRILAYRLCIIHQAKWGGTKDNPELAPYYDAMAEAAKYEALCTLRLVQKFSMQYAISEG